MENNAYKNYQKNNSTNPSSMQDLRCYSATYASSSSAQNSVVNDLDIADKWKFKKVKSANGAISKRWNFSDPEMQRKKRVASYKAYTVEGKLKGSIKKSFRWIKDKCAVVVYGHR